MFLLARELAQLDLQFMVVAGRELLVLYGEEGLARGHHSVAVGRARQ